jgi:hypothetical protein
MGFEKTKALPNCIAHNRWARWPVFVGRHEGLVKDVSNYTSNSQRCQD